MATRKPTTKTAATPTKAPPNAPGSTSMELLGIDLTPVTTPPPNAPGNGSMELLGVDLMTSVPSETEASPEG